MYLPFNAHAKIQLDYMVDCLLIPPFPVHGTCRLVSDLDHKLSSKVIPLAGQSSSFGTVEMQELSFEDIMPVLVNLAELASISQDGDKTGRSIDLCSNILTAANLLKEKLPFNASLQVFHAVYLVSCYSPSVEQQRVATRMYLEKWPHSIP